MIHSKSIKGSENWKPKPEPTTKTGKILKKIRRFLEEYVYYPVEREIRVFRERFSRSLAYARFGWMHFDFDHAYIWDLMAFKLRRILDVLVDGHLHQDPESIKALKEAIKICDRLHEQNYEDKYHTAHDRKWGRLKHKDIPNYDANGKIVSYTWDMSRPKAKTKGQKEKERKDFLKILENGERDRRADLDRLNVILKEHEQKWWD